MYCKYCGKEIGEGCSFCPYCGKDLRIGELDSAGSHVPSSQVQAPRKNANKKKRIPIWAKTAVVSVMIAAAAGGGCAFAEFYGGISISEKAAQLGSAAVRGGEKVLKLIGIQKGQTTDSKTSDVAAQNADSGTDADQNAAVAAGAGDNAGAVIDGSEDTGIRAGEGQSVIIDGNTIAALARSSFMSLITPASVDAAAQVPPYTIDADLGNVSGTENLYISDPSMLALNGFIVEGRGGANEFYEIYETNRYNYCRNFITSDSMMHTYHLYFSYLQKTVEQNNLRGMLLDLSRQMLTKSSQQYDALVGTEWESAARRNTAFFAIGASLLDSGTAVPADIADVTAEELALIQNASGIQVSPLMDRGNGEYSEDYSQYKPRGYYDENDDLRSYFRAMMWYGRIGFSVKDEELSRSALLMTLALDQDTAPVWEQIYEITSFFAGESDDLSYYEYKPIANAIYGENSSAESLIGNEEAWMKFLAAAEVMPAPKISSLAGTDDSEQEKGYRFMGQRYSFDEEIFTKLAGNAVGTDASGNVRLLPDALDVPAAMGSDAALQLVTARGAGAFAKYTVHMQALRDETSSRDESTWKSSLSSEWMYTLQPLLEPVGEGYPVFMQTDAWGRKELATFLGSYTELKHDTVLYGKQFMSEAGGELPEKVDDRGYVEPVPKLYARLKDLTDATSAGLSQFGILSDSQAQDLSILSSLCDQLITISEKELCGELPSDEEFELIRSFGAQLEHFWQQAHQAEADASDEEMTTMLYPAAMVTDVASSSSGVCLELGTGRALWMTVVVPLDGQLVLASGPVYSFYQFTQPSSDRLTDAQWCQMLGIQPVDQFTFEDNAPPMEDWISDFTEQD